MLRRGVSAGEGIQAGRNRPPIAIAHTGGVRLDPADELTELVPLDEAPALACVSRRTLNRWIASGRLTVYEVRGYTGRYVREGELLDVEHERRKARRQGRPGARVNVA